MSVDFPRYVLLCVCRGFAKDQSHVLGVLRTSINTIPKLETIRGFGNLGLSGHTRRAVVGECSIGSSVLIR
jgi:hypothetical protein